MAINIPMPGSPGDAFSKGIESGRGLFQDMLKKKLLPYQIAQYEQAAALAPLQQELTQAQTEQALGSAGLSRYKSDPQARIQYMRSLLQAFNTPDSQPQISGMMESPADGSVQPQQLPLTGGEGGQSSEMDLTSPQMNALSQIFKSELGFDPYESQREIQEFKKKKEYEQGLTTTKTRGEDEQIINSGEDLIRTLKKLKETPIPKVLGGWGESLANPNVRANFEMLQSGVVDQLTKAYNYLGIKESIKKASDQVKRHTGESDENFYNRLEYLINDANLRVKNAQRRRQQGTSQPQQQPSSRRKRYNPGTGKLE